MERFERMKDAACKADRVLGIPEASYICMNRECALSWQSLVAPTIYFSSS